MNEKTVATLLESVSSFCVGRNSWRIELINRPNKATLFRCHNVFMADHLPDDIPFMIDLQEYQPARLRFPSSEARQAADEYGVREYLKEIVMANIKEA